MLIPGLKILPRGKTPGLCRKKSVYFTVWKIKSSPHCGVAVTKALYRCSHHHALEDNLVYLWVEGTGWLLHLGSVFPEGSRWKVCVALEPGPISQTALFVAGR